MKNLLLFLVILVCHSVSAQNSDSSHIYLQKGLDEKLAKRWLVAHNYFVNAIKFDPKAIQPLIEDAGVALEMRKTDLAKDDFTKILEIDPVNKNAIKELTDLYFSYRQYDKAVEFAKKCSDCDNAQRVLGLSFYEQEDYPQAIKYLTAAVAKNASDAVATYTLARTYLDMEQYKKAVPYYEKAVSLDATRNVWMYELGLIYYNVADYKNAVTFFTKAADNGYVQSNDFKENLGYASLYTGEYEKGETLLMNVWNRKPGNKDILRDVAEILYQQKQYDKSLIYCQKLMELDAKDGKALYQAGMCFMKNGQKDRGQQMCDKAISIDPSLDGLRKKKEMVGM